MYFSLSSLFPLHSVSSLHQFVTFSTCIRGLSHWTLTHNLLNDPTLLPATWRAAQPIHLFLFLILNYQKLPPTIEKVSTNHTSPHHLKGGNEPNLLCHKQHSNTEICPAYPHNQVARIGFTIDITHHCSLGLALNSFSESRTFDIVSAL